MLGKLDQFFPCQSKSLSIYTIKENFPYRYIFRMKQSSRYVFVYLTIIPRVRFGWAKLAIIISYPTSASGIIVLLKTPTKYREFFPTIFVKTTDLQLVFNFAQTRTVTYHGYQRFFSRAVGIFGVGQRPTHLRP